MEQDRESVLYREWLDNVQELEYDLDRGYGLLMDAESDAIKSLHEEARARLVVMERIALEAATLTRERNDWE